MYNEVIILLSGSPTVNDIGDTLEAVAEDALIRKEVFAKVKSVSMKENYEGFAVGLKPECVFVLADYYDYDGQKDIEYNGVHYSVFRHYRRPGCNELELVVVADASS